jgi:hypothetical protein
MLQLRLGVSEPCLLLYILYSRIANANRKQVLLHPAFRLDEGMQPYLRTLQEGQSKGGLMEKGGQGAQMRFWEQQTRFS